MCPERRKRLVQEQGGTYLTFGSPNAAYLQLSQMLGIEETQATVPLLLNRMGDLPRNFNRNRYQKTKQKQKASVHNTVRSSEGRQRGVWIQETLQNSTRK